MRNLLKQLCNLKLQIKQMFQFLFFNEENAFVYVIK